MIERTEWRRVLQELDHEINNLGIIIPSEFWNEDIPPGSMEAVEVMDNLELPSKARAIEILEDKQSNSYYDVLRAELCVALVKRHQLLQANLSPEELDELREKSKGRGRWFIPDVE
jgi:hypothetical protein